MSALKRGTRKSVTASSPEDPTTSHQAKSATRRTTPLEVLAAMKPGIRYSTAMLAAELGQTVQAVNPVLVMLASNGQIWQMPSQRNCIYWIPTEEEAAAFAQRQSRRITWNRGTLQGYDEQQRTFQALCMLTRHS